MAFCTNCGTEVAGGFCPNCGMPVAGMANPGPGAGAGAAASAAPAQALGTNLASALCYLLGFITGIIFLVLSPYNQNKIIRFHAFQSIFLNVGVFAFYALWALLFRAVALYDVYRLQRQDGEVAAGGRACRKTGLKLAETPRKQGATASNCFC